MRRAGWRQDVVAVGFLGVLLILAGCAPRDSSTDENRSGGFYGGVSGGVTRP
jgi:hypothetical protein